MGAARRENRIFRFSVAFRARQRARSWLLAVPRVPASPRETSFCCCRFGTKKQKDIFRAEAQRRGENKYRGALRAKRPTAILKVSLRFSRASARQHFAVPSVPASPRETSFCCCRFGTKKQKDIFRAEAQRRGENKYRGALREKRPTAILKVSLRLSRAPARHHFAVPSVPASPREISFCSSS